MSRIIKAADLKVLIPNESQTVIPAPSQSDDRPASTGGTVLDSANLIEDARRKADELVTQAQSQAESLLAQAEEDVEMFRLQAKEAGFEAGYQEGLVAGREEALRQAADLVTLLEDTVEEAAQVRASSLQALEDDFLKFSLLLADKIVKKSVSNDISWLTPIIRDSLHALGQVQEIVIRLNPVDYALIKEEEESLRLKVRAKLQFESDTSINQGGCLIESENGLIDARLEERLGKIARHLMEVLYDENY